jgi:hypothetical protein
MSRLILAAFAAALALATQAKPAAPVLVELNEVPTPNANQGLVLMALANNLREPIHGLTVERVGADGAGGERDTLVYEHGKPQARALRLFGASLAPGRWRVLGWPSIQNIGTPNKKKLVERPLPAAFLEPGFAEFEVRAGAVTDLGVLYERNTVGGLSVLLRSGRPVIGSPFMDGSAALALAAARGAATLGWSQPLSTEELERVETERNAVAALMRMREADDGSWWTGGAFGRVFRRDAAGTWRSYRVPGDPWVTVLEPNADGSAIAGTALGAVALLRGGEFVATPTAGLIDAPVIAAACTPTYSCLVAQVFELKARDKDATPAFMADVTHKAMADATRTLIVAWRGGSGDWKHVLTLPMKAPGAFAANSVDVDRVGERLIVNDTGSDQLHLIDAATGKITLRPMKKKNLLFEASGERLVGNGWHSDDLGATWEKAITSAGFWPLQYGAGRRILRRDYDAQGMAGNIVQTAWVSTDGGESWGDERELPEGQLTLGRKSQAFAMVETVNGTLTPSQVSWSTDDAATWVHDLAIHGTRDATGGVK